MRSVDLILRADALAIFIAGVLLYLQLNGHPLWLLPLLLLPDVSMVGYLGGPRLGAITYNAVHNLVLALGCLAFGWFAGIAPLALLGALLIAPWGWTARSATG